jgi:hypothetical protein
MEDEGTAAPLADCSLDPLSAGLPSKGDSSSAAATAAAAADDDDEEEEEDRTVAMRVDDRTVSFSSPSVSLRIIDDIK